MTPAFWTFKDLAFATVLILPSLFAAGLLARLLPGGKPIRELGAQMIMYLIWFLLLSLLFRMQYQRPLFASLRWVNPGWLFTCALGGAVLAYAVSWTAVEAGAPIIEPPYKNLLADRLSMMAFALAGVLAGPIAEELIFRGFVMPLFAKSMPGLLAAAAAAAPFALLHGPGFRWSWIHVVLVFFAGFVFGCVRWRLDSTLASAVTHSAYNLTFLAGYLVNNNG